MEVAILAVTKRYSSVCIAGVTSKEQWVRPVKKGELNLKDIHLVSGEYVSIGKVYDFDFIEHRPTQCQTENHLIGDTISHKLILSENQRKKLFQSLSENSLITSNPDLDITEILRSKNRSLILIGPVNIENIYFYSNGSPRITLKINSINVKGPNNITSLPCTDLKFRAFGKSLLKEGTTTSISLDENKFKNLTGANEVYITLGLTLLGGRPNGLQDNWPMVIGVHTLPDYTQVIDYNDV